MPWSFDEDADLIERQEDFARRHPRDTQRGWEYPYEDGREEMEMEMVIINPGTGPVDGSNEAHAVENMAHFVTDCHVKDVSCVRAPEKDYGDGRFAFLLYKETRCHEIQMPGIPLEKVRYMHEPGQNIWHFPRLYADGSSFVWCYALLSEEDFREPSE